MIDAIIPGETGKERARRLAGALIGTLHKPSGFRNAQSLAKEAYAYHVLTPYPIFAFQDWRTEEKGPLPRCLPLARSIVRKGAKWLFAKPLQIWVQQNAELQKFLRRAWQKNRMHTRMVVAAEKGGYEGGVVLKWSYDETNDPEVCFDLLSPIDNARLYFDPLDRDRILMARVQYPYFNEVEGQWFIYREEWTDELEVHYHPVRAREVRSTVGEVVRYVAFDTGEDPDVYGKWEISGQEANPFGVIPMHLIRNIETDNVYGAGDLWNLFRMIDRVNLTYHSMDRSNQLDSEPVQVFIDAMADKQDPDRVEPSGAVSLKTDDAEGQSPGRRADVKLLEPSGNLREHIRNYALDVKKMIYDAVGYTEVSLEEITNKGNLTQAVLTQLYAPLIEATEEKRKTYGEDGICKFLEKCCVGLRNLGVSGLPEFSSDESFSVTLQWPHYFEHTEDEKLAEVQRISLEESCGYTTRSRAIRAVASMEGLEDVPDLVEELTVGKES